MGQLENGDDKDFVLSSSYQDDEKLGSREDLYYGSASNVSGAQASKTIYIAIGGFLILIVLSVVVLTRSYSLAEKAQLLALESRLEQLESRLGSIEGEGGLSQTAGQGNQLILLTERLDQLEANLTARINSMANQLQSASAKPVGEAAAKTEADRERLQREQRAAVAAASERRKSARKRAKERAKKRTRGKIKVYGGDDPLGGL